MKITKRQLRRIIREAVEQTGHAAFVKDFDAAYKQPDGSYKGHPDEAVDPPRSKGARARMNSKGYQDGLDGVMPVSMSSLKDPDYMAGKKAGSRDRSNDPYANHSFTELDLDTWEER